MDFITTMMSTRWAWPIAEVVHFIGLCLLFGTVALFDLRMLGIARGVPLRSLHRLIRFGIVGFVLSVLSGLCFFLAFPDQYLYNPAMQVKLALIALAGVNMVLFYVIAARTVWLTPDDGVPPPPARVFGAISLLCWLGVITCGRVITAFRPPFYWCLWC
jgi:hypothetical protein